MEIQIMYTIRKKQNENTGYRNSFMADDIFHELPELEEILEIESIYVPPELRCNGIGSKLIEVVTKRNMNKLICLASRMLVKEFPEKPTDEQTRECFEKLDHFFTKNSFANINDLVCYQGKVAYVYLNDLGKKLINSYKEKQV